MLEVKCFALLQMVCVNRIVKGFSCYIKSLLNSLSIRGFPKESTAIDPWIINLLYALQNIWIAHIQYKPLQYDNQLSIYNVNIFCLSQMLRWFSSQILLSFCFDWKGGAMVFLNLAHCVSEWQSKLKSVWDGGIDGGPDMAYRGSRAA